jgi:hypothetical protein
MVHEIVGRINGAFGTLTYVPIHHLDRQLSFHELCALYAITGVGGWGSGDTEEEEEDTFRDHIAVKSTR